MLITTYKNVILISFIFFLAVPAYAGSLPAPPFKKSWCYETGDQISAHWLCGDVICYEAGNVGRRGGEKGARDGDGRADEVEKRLGTDPHNSDTNRDGLIDSTDRNPLVAPRTLQDREKVLQAAFEGRFCFSSGDGYKVPCLVTIPQGFEPLEFFGYDWVIIPRRKGESSPLSQTIATFEPIGTAAVSFHAPRCDFEGKPVKRGNEKRGEDIILWNRDKTEARIHIQIFYSGLSAEGLDVHLKKIGDKSIVIDLLRAWIS